MSSASDKSQLAADRLAQYQLSAQPFAAPETCDAVYRNTALDMLANTIVQQLQSGDRIHIITGEKGIGKTTFCLRLECEAPDELLICRFTAARQSRINDVLISLIDSVEDIEGTDTQALATAAAQAVFRQLRNHQQPVLLVDDAHRLNTAVLRMLLRFHRSIEKQGLGQLKLVLLTEKQIERKLAELDNAAPDDARLQTHLLRPLNRNDIDDYLVFRFEQAGGSQPPLNTRELQYIRTHAGGLPGRVNALTCRVLNGALPSPSRRWIAGGAGAALLLAVGAAWFYLGEDDAIPPSRSADTTQPAAPAATEARPDAGDAGTVAKTPAEAADSQPGAAMNETQAGDDTTPPEGPVEQDESQPPDRPDSASETNTGSSESVPAVDAPPPTAPAQSGMPIHRWPADHYAVQLAGAWKPDRLNAIVDEYGTEYDLLVHRVDRNDQTWYVLLYGAFPDPQSAEAAISGLPGPIRDNRPWVRPIRGLLTP